MIGWDYDKNKGFGRLFYELSFVGVYYELVLIMIGGKHAYNWVKLHV